MGKRSRRIKPAPAIGELKSLAKTDTAVLSNAAQVKVNSQVETQNPSLHTCESNSHFHPVTKELGSHADNASNGKDQLPGWFTGFSPGEALDHAI